MIQAMKERNKSELEKSSGNNLKFFKNYFRNE